MTTLHSFIKYFLGNRFSFFHVDIKKTSMYISELIYKLPIPTDKQKVLYDIILQFVTGYSNGEETIQRLRQLFIETDEHENENYPPINTHIDFQNRLNSIIDELWNMAVEEKYLKYRKLFDDFRELFRT